MSEDGKWVDRHVLGSDKQRWTLGRAAGEVDFPMNHTTISRPRATPRVFHEPREERRKKEERETDTIRHHQTQRGP